MFEKICLTGMQEFQLAGYDKQSAQRQGITSETFLLTDGWEIHTTNYGILAIPDKFQV